MNPHLRRALEPAKLGKLALKNRILKAATYEGKTPGGVPGKALLNFHRRIVQGGVAMTTIGYCTTEADGRINDQMMWIHDGIEQALGDIVSELKQAAPDVAISGQMTHCGGFSKIRNTQRVKRPLGPSTTFNMLGTPSGVPISGAMTLADIDAVVDSYGRAAAQMKRMGFDAAEIHFGHGYGLSQFISPYTNKRTDEYGGSFENRMRFPLRALEAVKAAVGDDFPVMGKMNLTDGVSKGIHLEEAIKVAQALDKAGIDGLICSGGTSPYNPMVYFRGDSLAKGMTEQQSNLIAKIGLKAIGKFLFKEYPYEELYFLEDALKVRDAVKCQMIYIGGCTEVKSLEKVMQAGFDFVQLGRPLIKDPNFVLNMQADPENYKNGCIHCNRCASLIEAPGGVYCPEN